MATRQNRRDFLRTSAAAGAAGSMVLGGAPAFIRDLRAQSPNEKVRFACIGVGGKGSSDTEDAGKHGEITALCDVDANTLNRMAEQFPNAKKYSDYREMFAELADQIDAITVSTPDHTHAPASVAGMKLGKHCFCQKPLTWSVEEARVMRELAAAKHLCTQMGNQGTGADGFRRGVEVIRKEFTTAGVLGPVTEIQTWTNRPIWPQGIPRPEGSDPVPDTLNWDCFLGPAPERPYHRESYHPFAWRGWLDYGTGALGDMACHTINVAAMGLELFDPETIEVLDTSGIVDNETYAEWSIIKYHFGPRNGRGPLTLTWYSGGERVPEDKRGYRDFLNGQEAAGSGLIVIGEKGSFYSKNDYGSDFVLTPTADFEGYTPPEPTLPRSPGHFTEWVEAIKAGDPSKALSNFDYAGRLTETVLLGVVAEKARAKIEWDAESMTAKGNPDDLGSIRREYRDGFSIHD